MPTITKLKKKKRENYHYQKTDEIRKIYNSAKWVNLRRAYMMQHPLCERCLSNDLVKPTEEIHHIKPISMGTTELEMKELALNPNNLIALCKECHHQIHRELKKS